MKNPEDKDRITFDLSPDQVQAVERLAGERKVRLSGEVKNGRFIVDSIGFADKEFSQAIFVPVNAPFKAAQSLRT